MRFSSLDSDWRFSGFEPGACKLESLSLPGVDVSGWLPVSVPGDVNSALVKAGRMPSPHFSDDAKACYWVSSKDWCYRLEFAYDACSCSCGSVAELCLDGLDGFADIFLNGSKLGRAENAFRSYRFDVSKLLKAGSVNVLAIRFQAIDSVMRGPRRDELKGWNNWRALMRKPQFNFGWDWALPLPSIGIAGGVRIERHDGRRLMDVSVQPRISGRLDFKFEASSSAARSGYELAVRVKGHGNDISKRLKLDCVRSYVSVSLEDPQLWWPSGMGAQPLYDYSVEMLCDGTAVDSRKGRAGLREVAILEEPFTEDAGRGISFWLQVNGERVFSKGGNWIPTELWPADSTDEQLLYYLRKTAEANFNMLRVWGGGIYEKDLFYELCDELGIMVWQDFMFAGAGYPLSLLREEIAAEAQEQIRRLRSHPCICLWCGCNEDVYSWKLPSQESRNPSSDELPVSKDGASLEVDRVHDDPQLYTMMLRGLVSRFGLGVPYVESSPQAHDDSGNSLSSGNSHQSSWKFALFETDGHYERWRAHFDRTCSFDSEFCIQGPSDARTIKSFLPEGHHWPPDELWTYHIQRGHADLPHWEQHMMIGEACFGKIDDLQAYVKYGQAVHVEQMRAEFECARRDRPNNGGTMMWMLNDCWPTSNWSIIDYFRRPKPCYYAAKRACAPRLGIVSERKGVFEFHFSNETREGVAIRLRLGQARLDGSEAWAEEMSLTVDANSCLLIKKIPRASLAFASGDYLFLEVEEPGGDAHPKAVYFPDMWKGIAWPEPGLRLSLEGEARLAEGVWLSRVKVSAERFARLCHILTDDPALEFDDNFFDLAAGSSRVVEVKGRGPLKLDSLRAGHWNTDWQ